MQQIISPEADLLSTLEHIAEFNDDDNVGVVSESEPETGSQGGNVEERSEAEAMDEEEVYTSLDYIMKMRPEKINTEGNMFWTQALWQTLFKAVNFFYFKVLVGLHCNNYPGGKHSFSHLGSV